MKAKTADLKHTCEKIIELFKEIRKCNPNDLESYAERLGIEVEKHALRSVMDYKNSVQIATTGSVEEAAELYTKQFQQPSPVSDEDIDEIANQLFRNTRVNIIKKIKQLRSRLQQPVAIEWPDMVFVKTESKEYSERYEDHLQDTAELAFREGMVSMVLELKSRVKVVDPVDFAVWIRQNTIESTIAIANELSVLRTRQNNELYYYPKENIWIKDTKELFKVYQRTREGSKG